jgi:beta-glucosidase
VPKSFIVFHDAVVGSLLSLIFANFCSAQRVEPSNPQLVDPAIERRVDELLGRMTLDEKIGQLVQYSASQARTTGPNTAALNVNPPGPGGVDSYQLAESGKLGSMLNTVVPRGALALGARA